MTLNEVPNGEYFIFQGRFCRKLRDRFTEKNTLASCECAEFAEREDGKWTFHRVPRHDTNWNPYCEVKIATVNIS